MWTLLKFIGHLLKGFFWLALALLLAGIVVLYFLERGIPSSLLRKLEAAASTDDIYVRIERATYSLKNGARLFRIKVLPKRVAGNAWVSADEVAFDIALTPGLTLHERLRGVTVKNIAMPALPPKTHDSRQPPKPISECPAFAPFPLTVETADILGIKVERLTATITSTGSRLSASDIAIRLPNPTFELAVNANVTADLTTGLVSGTAKGQALPENLLPLFYALKARGAVEQITCFSKVTRPIDADYTFDVEIDTTDFAMRLELDVGPCSYRGVPIAYAKGTLGIYGTNIYTTVVVDPLEAKTVAGAPITGQLIYREETEGLGVDISTTMDIKPLFDILDILNHGELDQIQCESPPTLSARGAVALSPTESTITNDLIGKVSLPAGSILNFAAKDMTADFALSDHSARFSNFAAASRNGGKITGDIIFLFPDYAATATVFTANIRLHDVALEEISHAFNVTNARAGLVSGTLRIDGPTHARTIEHLAGAGHVDIRDGVINRMKLFAGFTDYLSRVIPGVSSLVNQSSGSMDFTILESVLKTDNLLLEGDIFSIMGRGTYDIAADKLDFVIRANIFKQQTLAGKITHFVTFPFTRLLLEFKVFGSLEDPDWSYVNIIEKITDGFSSKPAPEVRAPTAP